VQHELPAEGRGQHLHGEVVARRSEPADTNTISLRAAARWKVSRMSSRSSRR
jgi:hypothetical protein